MAVHSRCGQYEQGKAEEGKVIEPMQQNQTQIEPWLNPSPPIYFALARLRPCEIDKMYRGRRVELRCLILPVLFSCTAEKPTAGNNCVPVIL